MTCTSSDRLRWIADYLELAGKALSLIACVQGIDYPHELHRDAQRDLRAFAKQLEASPRFVEDCSALRADNDPLFQVMARLRCSAAAVGRLCGGSYPPMELLEVNHEIQCALIRTNEYAESSVLTRNQSMSADKGEPLSGVEPSETRASDMGHGDENSTCNPLRRRSQADEYSS
jgi:hypothetical protein